MTNSFLITKELFRLLGIPYSRNFLKDVLDSHPEPESLLSISDALAKYKVDTLAVQIGGEKLDQIPLPCIVQIKGESHPFFSYLSQVTEDRVAYMDMKGKTENIERNQFLSMWTGVTLILEKGENSTEPGYKGRRKDLLVYRSLLFSLGTVGLFLLTGVLSGLSGNMAYSIGALVLFILKLAGLVISGILLWSEVDKDNSAIKEFCTGSENIDCNSVINSFSLGGAISLGNLAFAYFVSGFFLLLLTTFSGPALQLLGYLSFASLMIVPISLYYQWQKIKKWCVLCLWVSGVLVLEFVASQFLLVNLDPPGLMELGIFSFLFLASILGWLSLKPYLLAKKDMQGLRSKLAKFMSNKEVFDYLLSGSRKISSNPDRLGILLKGQATKYHVLKVCNPYCGPCARTHPVLEELYNDGNIDLQILFLPGGEDEVRSKTISHLMGIASKGNTAYTRQALDDWYGSEKKDYAVFAEKYPLNGELKEQGNVIQAMQDWGKVENITHTPTIFINGYEIPSLYTVEDLKYVLT